MQWFANDGGPMLLLPRAAAAAWEGADPPAGRVVVAVTRWDGGADATDYDRACDVDAAAGLLPVAGSWAVALPGDLAGSVAWLPGADPGALVAVAVAATDDDSPAFLRRAYGEVAPGAWATVAAGVDAPAGGLLLLHAASAGADTLVGASGPDGVAVIGDALAADARPGRYVIEAAEVARPDAELLFCRLRLAGGAGPAGAGAPAT